MLGSTLSILMSERRLGRTKADRLTQLNQDMDTWYRDRPGYNRLPSLRPNNFATEGGWSELHGPAVKAVMCRCAVPMVRDLAYQYLPADTDRDQSIHRLLDAFVDFYEILWSQPIFMSDESLRRLETVLIIIGEEWMHLREVARLAGHAHWKITTKTHKQQHTLVYARALNPRFVQ